ncbi:MAG: hypothetical protein BWX72_00050 [Firmicutes bacterium ADurb.Bin080]|nr:MAG: hypothetical protein BWX72_00050 [Firmicutes bacterium ADurb.Bin080]
MDKEDVTNNTESNLTPAEIKPEMIDISSIGDATSINNVTLFVNKHTLIDNAGIFADITNFLNTPVPESESDRKSLAVKGIELLKEFNAKLNIAENGVDAVFTKYSIYRGQILIQLKKLVKKAGQSWQSWSTSQVPFVSERTRIDNMRLAYRQDCYDYYFLGSERLLMLIRATEGYKGKDKIGDFMRKYGIKFNPDSREQLKQFKQVVDTALNMERLEKVNVRATPQNVKSLTQYMPVMDNNFLMKSKAIAESGGDVDKYYEKLITNKGKEKSPFEIIKATADFNTSGKRLIQIIDYMMKNENTVETLEEKIVKDLENKISELKKFANIQ